MELRQWRCERGKLVSSRHEWTCLKLVVIILGGKENESIYIHAVPRVASTGGIMLIKSNWNILVTSALTKMWEGKRANNWQIVTPVLKRYERKRQYNNLPDRDVRGKESFPVTDSYFVSDRYGRKGDSNIPPGKNMGGAESKQLAYSNSL